MVITIQKALWPFWVGFTKRMDRIMSQIEDLTAIVTRLEGDAATVATFVSSEQTALQNAINELNAHPAVTNDPALGALITRLQTVSTNLETVTAPAPAVTAPTGPTPPVTDPTAAVDPNAATNTAPAQQPADTTSTAPTAPAAPAS